MISKKRSLIEIILVLATFVFLPIFFAPLLFIGDEGSVLKSNMYNIVSILTDITIVVVLIVYLRSVKRFPEQKVSLSDTGGLNLFLMILCAYLISSVYEVLLYIFPMDSMIELYMELIEVYFDGSPILAFICIAVGAPVVEELIFRGFIYRNLRFHHGYWVAALISSFMWAVVHLNLVQGIQAMVLGLFLSFVYEKTYKLWIPILLHFIINAASTFAYYLLGPDASMVGLTDESPMSALVFAAVAGIAICILIVTVLVHRTYPNSDVISRENRENAERLKMTLTARKSAQTYQPYQQYQNPQQIQIEPPVQPPSVAPKTPNGIEK